MKQTRRRLVALVESHDVENCPGCPVCEEILSLRKQIGFVKRQSKGSENEVAFDMAVKEFVNMRFVQKFSFMKIAREKGVSDATIHLWKNNHDKEIKAEMERQNITETIKPRKEIVQEKSPLQELASDIHEKYETEIRLLKERLTDAQGKLDASNLTIKTLDAENESLRAAQLLVVDQNTDKLTEENQLLKSLLKHYL